MTNFLFDLYGVLLKLDGYMNREYLQKVTGGDESMWPIYNELRHDYDAGLIPPERFWLNFADRTGLVFNMDEVIAADNHGWLPADLEMVGYLRSLIDAGHRVGLLSNIPHPLAVEVKRRNAWLNDFHSVTFSCEIGVAKPDPRAWEIALEQLGTKAEETHFFDDTLVNVEQAAKLGLQAHHFQGIDTLRAVVQNQKD